MKLIHRLLITLFTVTVIDAASAQIVVVANANSTISPLSRDQVTALFLGKSLQLPNGNSAVLYDQSESNDLRQLFYSKVTDKSVAQVKALWSRLVFSGKAAPPKEVGNSAEVKKALASNPNSLGYIEKSAVDSSVKVLYSAE